MGRPTQKKNWEELNKTSGQIIGEIADQLSLRNDRDYYELNPAKYLDLFPFIPWSKQKEIFLSVIENKVTLVRASNDLGKTHTEGQLVNFWMDIYRPRGRDTKTKVISTAQTYDHTRFMLWTRIREMYKHVAHRFANAHMNQTDFQPDPDNYAEWFALGLNPRIEGEEAVSFQGHHGQHVLFMVDEAITTPRAIFKAIEGSLLDYGSRAIYVYNPTTTIGSEVYQMEQDLHLYDNKEGPDYKKYMNLITMNCEDLFASPEWIANPERFRELVSPDARDRLIQKYGRKHPVVKARLFAEWPDQDEEAAINNEGLQFCFKRYKEEMEEIGIIKRICYGWDVAGEGSDTNVLYRILVGDNRKNYLPGDEATSDRDILKIEKIRQWNSSHPKSIRDVYAQCVDDYHETLRYNQDFCEEFKLQFNVELSACLVVDAIGEGSHVPSTMEEMDEENEILEVFSFKAGERDSPNPIEEREEIVIMNKISECWYRANMVFGELIPEWPICMIEPNKDLEHELKDRKYFYQKKGKEPLVYYIEPKDEYKKRNRNRSPDHADAFLMALFGYFYEIVNTPRIESIG
jgi:phage terminase large subunit